MLLRNIDNQSLSGRSSGTSALRLGEEIGPGANLLNAGIIWGLKVWRTFYPVLSAIY